MSFAVRVIMFAVPLLLIILTGVAGYAYLQIRTLHLPIPSILPLLTILLPLLTGASTRLTQKVLLKSSKTPTLPLPTLFILTSQFLTETILITLTLTLTLPEQTTTCLLKNRWQALFSAKERNAIRTIQDRFNCCGLMTTKNQAWPFPDSKHTAAACEETFGRSKACLGDWRRVQRVYGGLLVGVILGVVVVKVGVLVWVVGGFGGVGKRGWMGRVRLGNGGGEVERRLISGREGGAGVGGVGEGYRDDVEGNGNGGGQGPRVEPSTLRSVDGRNVWSENSAAGTA